jgi:RNA polymerase sigma-70 factor (ECF subfamily)
MEEFVGHSKSAPVATLAEGPHRSLSIVDSVAHLTEVYRDFPGLRALIVRRVRDPEVAADILQDAAVTTLEKLRLGEIADPANIGGYLYRVALNHLRNHCRKDRSQVSDSDGIDDLASPDTDPEWDLIGRPQWAAAIRRVLRELPTPRDRDLLIRYYLQDEDKDHISRELNLTEEHFNRVIFRARNRFRELLERRGFWKSDFLSIIALGFSLLAMAHARLGGAP